MSITVKMKRRGGGKKMKMSTYAHGGKVKGYAHGGKHEETDVEKVEHAMNSPKKGGRMGTAAETSEDRKIAKLVAKGHENRKKHGGEPKEEKGMFATYKEGLDKSGKAIKKATR